MPEPNLFLIFIKPLEEKINFKWLDKKIKCLALDTEWQTAKSSLELKR